IRHPRRPHRGRANGADRPHHLHRRRGRTSPGHRPSRGAAQGGRARLGLDGRELLRRPADDNLYGVKDYLFYDLDVLHLYDPAADGVEHAGSEVYEAEGLREPPPPGLVQDLREVTSSFRSQHRPTNTAQGSRHAAVVTRTWMLDGPTAPVTICVGSPRLSTARM